MKGRFSGYFLDPQNNAVNVLISIKGQEIKETYDRLKDKDLEVHIKQYREHRSKDANALLWACIGELSTALHIDKWELYLMLLKRYGKYTYICVKPNVVESMQRQWRECEVIGEIDINGTKAVQMLCYFGSSTYDSREFSELLDGVIDEMKECGLPTPTSEDMRRSLEEWQNKSFNP